MSSSVIVPTANTNADAMPNYRHGARNVVIAIRTTKGTATTPAVYGTPYNEVGIESITPSRAERPKGAYFSDDGKPSNVSGARGNDTYAMQFASMSPYFELNVLKHIQNPTTGGVVKSYDDEPAVIAVGWEVQGTEHPDRIWIYGCEPSEPTPSAFQSHNDSVPTESPETLNLTVMGDFFADGKGHYEEVCHYGQPGYATFLDAVPTYATN